MFGVGLSSGVRYSLFGDFGNLFDLSDSHYSFQDDEIWDPF